MGFSLANLLLGKGRKGSRDSAEVAPTNVLCIRLAVYDSESAEPRIIDIEKTNVGDLISEASNRVYEECRRNGGKIPFTVIREVVENLIHADFKDSVISISPDGNRLSVSDHGPGVSDKEKAFIPGYTTATQDQRRFIKGVGSGLPVARETIGILGGDITIDNNLRSGSVVTVQLPSARTDTRLDSERPAEHISQVREKTEKTDAISAAQPRASEGQDPEVAGPAKTQTARDIAASSLSDRQKKLLLLAAELGEIGPSIAAKELDMSLSTAYRDLVTLEELHLLKSVESGKRKLTDQGVEFLSFLFQ